MNKKTIVITSIITAIAVFVLTTLFYLSPLGVVFVGRLSDSSVSKFYGKLIKIEKIIEDEYMGSYNSDRMMSYAVQSYVEALRDPYSAYYSPSAYKDITAELDGEYRGIGVVVGTRNGEIIVKSVNSSSPAEKAGILKDDVLLSVNGTDYPAEKLAEAVNVIKGTKVGNTVSLGIRRGEEILTIDIKIEKVKEILVTHRVIDGNVGYIRLSSFGTNVGPEFAGTLKELEKENIKALIIDLRSNPGGTLDSATAIADLLLPKGDIVTIKDKKGNEEVYTSDKKELNLPMCVLINEQSASASEVLAGALKDYNKAILVGKKSFGKGVVQSVMDLGDGSGLSLTIAKYYTPSGECIHGVGIEPDIEVDLPEDADFMIGEEDKNDTQLAAALEAIKKQIK
ncbi:MAG: S41 family peptidase [Clostridia bacterium]|nr:S41 family peptidase [Clostridia bacterium]